MIISQDGTFLHILQYNIVVYFFLPKLENTSICMYQVPVHNYFLH